MLFNSAIFLLFFLVVFLAYWHLPHRQRAAWLLVASLFFYGWWSLPFLGHFLLMVLVNYAIYATMGGRHTRLSVIAVALINLANLAFFKYFYFFARILYDLTGLPALAEVVPGNESVVPEIVLPLAISFYTFQILAFHIDVYRGQLHQRVSALHFTLFIMFFPQLIAGPIMRHDQFLPKIERRKRPSRRMFHSGIILILVGLTKKVIIADSIGVLIAPVFASPGDFSGAMNILAAYAFAVQIYCDFAGYSDMARGLAMLLGYKIPENFRGPFLSISVREFWSRWHITLTTWLRDYLYFSLGGNRVASWRATLNIIVTMALAGLWHGANYTFLIWGLMLAFYLLAERMLGLLPGSDPVWWEKMIRRALVFTLVTATGVFFRAESVSVGVEMFLSMGQVAGDFVQGYSQLGWLFLLFGILHYAEYRPKPFMDYLLRRPIWIAPAAFLVAVAVSSISSQAQSFIYFQF